jgi:hypothetical protein
VPDHVLANRLYRLYAFLIQNKPVPKSLFSGFGDYINDPRGYGVSLNIAKLWDAIIRGDIEDKKEAVRMYISRHLSEDFGRARYMLKWMVTGDAKFKKQVLKNGPIHEIEIIPFEQVINYIEQLDL